MNSRPFKRGYFDRRSIRYPLARLIVAAVLVGLGLSLLSDAVFTLDNARKDIRRTLTAAANAAGTAVSAAVVFNDARVARDVLRMFEAYPEIEAAAVYTLEGRRLASYGNERRLPAEMTAVAPPALDIRLMDVRATLHQPIEMDAQAVGSVFLQARLDAYRHAYLTSIATTFLASLIAGILALVLAMRYLDQIILPVRRLADAANDARLRQDFSPRDIPAADDEVGDLVRDFNTLLAEVEASRQSSRRQHDEMEGLVEARTAELRAAKESADAANQAKSRFLAAASHDLRQPIHAMRLFLETLNETQLNDEQRQLTNYLSLSTRNLAEILNALLDVSKLDSGMVKALPEVINADVLIHKIEAEFAPLALAKGLRFKLFFPTRDLKLFTDAKLLASLLRNLIDNALKYTEAGGILVGFRHRRDSVLIQVWDTGIGIAPDHLEAIFDEYFQVGNPQRDRTKGLGLGLANAKRVADILGCPIRCRSRLDKGSLFELSVPLVKQPGLGADAASGRAAEGPGMPLSLRGCRVMVVEDDVLAAKATELSLAAHGLQVTVFGSAEAALADPHRMRADFYIVDFRLPGMNGIQFLEALEQQAGQPIKATLLTGETDIATLGSTSSAPWRVMLKPVDPTALMAVIEAQLAQRAPASGQAPAKGTGDRKDAP